MVLFFHFLKNLLCLFLVFRLTGDARQATGSTLLFMFLFLAFQGPPFLYIWDYIDTIVFLLFIYGGIQGIAFIHAARELLLVSETMLNANPVFAADRPIHEWKSIRNTIQTKRSSDVLCK